MASAGRDRTVIVPFQSVTRDVEMIGNLLKQLFPALGRFVEYYARRILHLPQRPRAAPPPPASTERVTATEASISALSDAVGLDPEYEKPVQWPCYRTDVPSQEVASGALYQLWTTFPGGHK